MVATQCEISNTVSSDGPTECLEYIWILLFLLTLQSLGYEQIPPVLKVENCSHSLGDHSF